MYAQVGCEKDSCHVQPELEQPTVLACGMKVEELEAFPEILQIKIEDVNSFGLAEEQSDQPNDLFVKVEVKTEHDIVHLDRPEPNDAEASLLKNYPHEDLFVKVEVQTEHDIDVHLDRPEPNDAEASLLKNHPFEGFWRCLRGWPKPIGANALTSSFERASPSGTAAISEDESSEIDDDEYQPKLQPLAPKRKRHRMVITPEVAAEMD
uniref:uncharacterized protein n=1 Tax=Myxine glutinosa TaxID=7769 RepID=UPI00358E37A0